MPTSQCYKTAMPALHFIALSCYKTMYTAQLDGSLPANPVNDRRVANAVTLKSTFCLP